MAKLIKCKTCGGEIAKNAKVCPHCGAKNKKKHVFLGIVLFIIGLFIFGSAFGSAMSTSGSSSSSSGSTSQKAVEPTNKPTISLEEFNAIETGMTYEEVVEIVGSEGEVLSEVDLGLGDEYVTTMYMWEGEGSVGANANVTIQGGQVTAKAQIGLK